ncbi:hypothetical protein GQS40_01190|uniref:Xylulose 5-phosphate/Fructose 6-phosphate phosphoketolase N-terminal domain-containing protein n=1 Tax=Leuconostoc lactis TaxID=1246 RepID=A0A6L7A8R9_LEULA|nr:hypothetical protein [Leuconostoc lactis]
MAIQKDARENGKYEDGTIPAWPVIRAVLDNPDQIAFAVVGDGEAETGPSMTSWLSSKFLNAKNDGAVLPILDLNGFKISNPTIFSRMSHEQVMVTNAYLDGEYTEDYPEITQDLAGMSRLFKRFSFPGGIGSHMTAQTPGSLHEGGELGYSLSHAFAGMIFLKSNPLFSVTNTPIQAEDVKVKPIGHWGTISGQTFLYAHANRLINKYDVNMFYIGGPGHGGHNQPIRCVILNKLGKSVILKE